MSCNDSAAVRLTSSCGFLRLLCYAPGRNTTTAGRGAAIGLVPPLRRSDPLPASDFPAAGLG